MVIELFTNNQSPITNKQYRVTSDERRTIYAKQTQFTKRPNKSKLLSHNELRIKTC